MRNVLKSTSFETLKSMIDAFDDYGRSILPLIGRELTEEGWLKSTRGNAVTKTYGIPVEDATQGVFYITHPDTLRGNWDDEYVDHLLTLVPEGVEEDSEFIPTPEEV